MILNSIKEATKIVSDNKSILFCGVGILLLSIPGYIVLTDSCHKKIFSKDVFFAKRDEEDFIALKLRSESLRPGPPFVQSIIYHNRRTERAKAAYTSAWNLVNQNLDNGNKLFEFTLDEEDDFNILNVVKVLLEEELEIDGYKAKIQIKEKKFAKVLKWHG